jgi:hypothetical protein
MEFAWYISGFIDGEGCFSVSFNLRSKLKTGIEVRPSFSVSQNKRSLRLIEQLQKYFHCGGIRFDKYDQTYKYEVRSIHDLIKKIIPHFEKYPLKTSKAGDFECFREICQKIYENQHLSFQYLPGIIEKAYQMNDAGKRKYTQAFLLKRLCKMKK